MLATRRRVREIGRTRSLINSRMQRKKERPTGAPKGTILAADFFNLFLHPEITNLNHSGKDITETRLREEVNLNLKGSIPTRFTAITKKNRLQIM